MKILLELRYLLLQILILLILENNLLKNFRNPTLELVDRLVTDPKLLIQNLIALANHPRKPLRNLNRNGLKI